MLGHFQLRENAPPDVLRFVVFAAEAEAEHRMGGRPVPVGVDVQTTEQRLPSLEQRPDRVHQQALAEPAGTGEEVMASLVHQSPDERGLVDVVEIPAPDRLEILDADGQALTGHDAFISCRLPCREMPGPVSKHVATVSGSVRTGHYFGVP